MAELLFHGAAGEVTGSMHMLHWQNRWIALDCGLFQGRRAESEAKNREWPVPPREISAVVVSHAHTDHTGRLPRLVKEGFDGPIFCTPATADLMGIMLPDSAHIQEEDVIFVNRKRKEKGLPPVDVLYDTEDALATIRLVESHPYERPFEVLPGLRVTYRDAGHMLGSASVHVEMIEEGQPRPTLLFTGDIGRPQTPILRDPVPFPPADYVISESTYGGRLNESTADAREHLAVAAARTFARRGKLIIPAFSVGRSQTMIYYLHQLITEKRIPRVPIFLDSPLAVNATDIFRAHPDCYDREARELFRHTGDILGGGDCTCIRDVEDSKALHTREGPFVIISASGMCEAGRILHHLRNNLRDSRNTILVPGYQAENTLGRRLVDGAKVVRLFHEEHPVHAEVVQVHGFSGHADQADLVRMLTPLAPRARNVFLVHGEREESRPLAEKLREAGLKKVTIAQRGNRAALA